MANKDRGDKDDDLRRLKLENQKLRRQVSALRKQLSRASTDENNKELLEAQDRQDQEFEVEVAKKKLFDKWKCKVCGKDSLRVVMFGRPDGDFYFRRCPTCNNKTRMKRYVEGKLVGIDDEGNEVKE